MHIGTQTPLAGQKWAYLFRPAANGGKPEPRPKPLLLTTHKGGTLVKLKGKGQAPTAAKRGRIKGYSRASRRHFMRFMASLNVERMAQPSFVTLTYPGQFPACPNAWKADLRAFLRRLQRRPGFQAAVWKLEPQKRWAPHFHLLVWTEQGLCNDFVAPSWWRVVGSKRPEHLAAGTQCDPIRSWGGVLAYSAKYVAKLENMQDLPPFWEHVGRWWGKVGTFPVDAEADELSEEAMFAVRRLLRRWQRRQTGRPCQTWGRAGMAAFMPEQAAATVRRYAESLAAG